MRKLTLILAVGAAGALAISAATRAEAGALAGAEGLRIAIDDVSNIQNVHYYWRRGYRARYGAWGPRWGWRRPYYRAAAWGHPGWGGYYGWRRPWGWRRAAWGYPGWGWGWRRPIYGAAWGPGFGIGVGWGRGWGWGGPRIGIGFGWGW